MSWHQLNSKNNVSGLLFKTICELSLFLSSVATNGKDGYELKLGKFGPTFSNFHATPAKSTNKIIMVSAP